MSSEFSRFSRWVPNDVVAFYEWGAGPEDRRVLEPLLRAAPMKTVWDTLGRFRNRDGRPPTIGFAREVTAAVRDWQARGPAQRPAAPGDPDLQDLARRSLELARLAERVLRRLHPDLLALATVPRENDAALTGFLAGERALALLDETTRPDEGETCHESQTSNPLLHRLGFSRLPSDALAALHDYLTALGEDGDPAQPPEHAERPALRLYLARRLTAYLRAELGSPMWGVVATTVNLLIDDLEPRLDESTVRQMEVAYIPVLGDLGRTPEADNVVSFPASAQPT